MAKKLSEKLRRLLHLKPFTSKVPYLALRDENSKQITRPLRDDLKKIKTPKGEEDE